MDTHSGLPLQIEMVGGYFDGRRMSIREFTDQILLPIPAHIDLGPEPDVTRAPLNAEVYRYAGSIRDDGTRVYRFSHRA